MSPRPLLLDLFCGAGGAAVGYHRAGFDVIGVDNRPQPHYPFRFHQADALDALHFAMLPYPTIWAGMPDWPMGPFAAIHASPPCQAYSIGARSKGTAYRHPDLLGPTRELLERTEVPWVIENVPGAPMRADYRLCGCMFGLPRLKRDRWFETSWHGFDLRAPCVHAESVVSVVDGGRQRNETDWLSLEDHQPTRERVMGIDWMTRDELVLAIPPAYTEYVGTQILAIL